jgi:hypothetical protein
VAGGQRRLHNLYIIRVIKSRRMIWAGHVAHMREMRNKCKILVEKLEGERLFGRSSYRWEDNIKINLREMWWEIVDWKHLAQNRDQ